MTLKKQTNHDETAIYRRYYPVGSEVQCKFLHAIDGDTILLQDLKFQRPIRVRIRGINCPELHKDQPLIAPDPFAEEAHLYTKNKLVQAQTIQLEVAEAHYDIYGRLLAHIKVDGTCLGRSLLKKGLATTCYLDNFENDTLANRFRQDERKGKKQAKQAFPNIWSLPNYVRNGKFYVRDVPASILVAIGYLVS